MGIPHTDTSTILTDDAARGGVTGHHVRHVLAYSLTGIIAAFAGLGLYFGHEALLASISNALAQNPSEVARAIAPYAAIILVGAIGAGLVLGIWNALAGRTDNASQFGMRLRVAAQFALVCVIMAIMYVSVG